MLALVTCAAVVGPDGPCLMELEPTATSLNSEVDPTAEARAAAALRNLIR